MTLDLRKAGPAGAKSAVTAVIVNYRTPGLVRTCLSALQLQRAEVPGLKAIVVDGGSDDGSAALLEALVTEPGFSDWVVFKALSINGGFGWANNEAFRLARRIDAWPDYFFVINPDAAVRDGALGALVAFLERTSGAAIAGSLIRDSKGRVAGSHAHFPTIASEVARGLNAPRLTRWLAPVVSNSAAVAPLRCDWVSGAGFLLRSSALVQCGGFDEGFFLYFEEVELMGRLADHGWEVWHVPDSIVDHVGGASTGVADGASAARRLPTYWHEARWRYFALRHSRTYALAASLGWAVGRAGSGLRHLGGGGRKHMHAPHELSDMARFITRGFPAVSPAFGKLDQPPGNAPAWMMRP